MRLLLQPYDPQWRAEFLLLKTVLCNELRECSFEIEHVGSTAIPGLIAKPILDVDIIITDKEQLQGLSKKLEQLGYIGKGEQGIPGRFAFRQSTDRTPASGNKKRWMNHHLYVCCSDILALKNHLFFKKALLTNEELLNTYCTLKKNLAVESGMTREKYNVRKTEFILSVLEKIGFGPNELDEIKRANS